MFREVEKSVEIPDLSQKFTESALRWHTLQCELVTPLYGGGVQAATVDEKMPIRASAIRGQLRFWWRLLAKHKADWDFKGDLDEIRKAESRLWGGAGNEVNASLVFLRVTELGTPDIKPWAKYEPHHKTGYKTLPTPEGWAKVPYVLFPAQGKKPGLPDSKSPGELAKPGLKWALNVAFNENARHEVKDKAGKVLKDAQGKPVKEKTLTQQDKDQVWEVIRWWASFGGLGARTRRGLGAIKISGHSNITPVGQDEAALAGCQLKLIAPPSNNADSAWTTSVNKLQSFRQGHSVGNNKIEVGRNKGSEENRPGRSKWSEPDAIRLITGQKLPRHAKRVTKGDYFPRAAFGLPIIFKFKDDGNSPHDEPAQSTLQPILTGESNPRERMASPLILRSYFNGQGWWAAALLLPHQHVDNLQLKLIQKRNNVERDFNAVYWSPVQAANVGPILNYNANNALDAFLNYFAE